MKYLLYFLVFMSLSVTAQDKYITKTGVVQFEASVPSFEEVAAKNNAVTGIINADNGEFAALAMVKAFRFKNALMEEHFNENYAESYLYPKATFKGTIDGFSLKTEKTTYKITGELNFHGVSKTISNIDITSVHKNDTIVIEGTFKVLASDFNIKIPKIVSNKIAEEIVVNFSFELVKQ
ncbi:YceI-like domain-containing protein [Flavobacteriaceae bacterium MAR_2010_72]|nr:YceI-like domain-containing protein [Flavobacteriaceae bacterium MAR_2010_72]TVZ58146.1 YceI-like domain-containing protein [Flavobacteriaceae bacterium MAR_2010_105]